MVSNITNYVIAGGPGLPSSEAIRRLNLGGYDLVLASAAGVVGVRGERDDYRRKNSEERKVVPVDETLGRNVDVLA
jgi:hypothetical protein